MKYIALLFFVFFLFSCVGEKNQSNEQVQEVKQEELQIIERQDEVDLKKEEHKVSQPTKDGGGNGDPENIKGQGRY